MLQSEKFGCVALAPQYVSSSLHACIMYLQRFTAAVGVSLQPIAVDVVVLPWQLVSMLDATDCCMCAVVAALLPVNIIQELMQCSSSRLDLGAMPEAAANTQLSSEDAAQGDNLKMGSQPNLLHIVTSQRDRFRTRWVLCCVCPQTPLLTWVAEKGHVMHKRSHTKTGQHPGQPSKVFRSAELACQPCSRFIHHTLSMLHRVSCAILFWAYHLVLAVLLPELAGVIRVGDITCRTTPLEMLETGT